MTIVYEQSPGRAHLPSVESTTSFWHSEPSQFLLGHRTTPELPTLADVVIVGSGITAASAARFLGEDERSKGLSILMLEAREVCWGATGRVRSFLSPSVAPWTSAVRDISLTAERNVRTGDTASL